MLENERRRQAEIMRSRLAEQRFRRRKNLKKTHDDEMKEAEKLILDAAGQIHNLTVEETALFKEKIAPLYSDAREQFGDIPFDLLENN